MAPDGWAIGRQRRVFPQGGETRVLLGADGMLRIRRVNILYVEWSGDPG